jgi:hypothetical protein
MLKKLLAILVIAVVCASLAARAWPRTMLQIFLFGNVVWSMDLSGRAKQTFYPPFSHD